MVDEKKKEKGYSTADDEIEATYKEWTFYKDCKYDEKENLIYHNTGDHEHWFEFNENNKCIHYKTTLCPPIINKATMDANTPGFWEFWKVYDDQNRILSYKDTQGYEHKYEYDERGDCIRTANSAGAYRFYYDGPYEMHVCQGDILHDHDQNR